MQRPRGPRPARNPRWLNVLAAAVVGALLTLSALLTVTTVAPRVPAVPTVTGLGIASAVLIGCGSIAVIRNTPGRALGVMADPRTWTMPPIESLDPPPRSALRILGLVTLRCYLLAAIAVLTARAVQLALASG